MYEVASHVVMVGRLFDVYVPVAIEFKYKLSSRRLRSASFRLSHQTSPFLALPKIRFSSVLDAMRCQYGR